MSNQKPEKPTFQVKPVTKPGEVMGDSKPINVSSINKNK